MTIRGGSRQAGIPRGLDAISRTRRSPSVTRPAKPASRPHPNEREALRSVQELDAPEMDAAHELTSIDTHVETSPGMGPPSGYAVRGEARTTNSNPALPSAFPNTKNQRLLGKLERARQHLLLLQPSDRRVRLLRTAMVRRDEVLLDALLDELGWRTSDH